MQRGQRHFGGAQGDRIPVGFVPLTDCAPVVMAQELGLFAGRGLRVELHRELGWATIRDKMLHGELVATHAPGAMPLAAALGLGTPPYDTLCPLVLSVQGNGITVSADLVRRGVTDGHSLRREIDRRGPTPAITFGVVASFSSHRYLLRRWLSAHGIDPDREVRMVVVPPRQSVANLQCGHLDGYCVGEPWNAAAEAVKAGRCIATSDTLEAGHLEKVLMVRADFAARRPQEHLALISALLESCRWCADPANRDDLELTLARREFVGVEPRILRAGVRGGCRFAGPGVNEPTHDKAAWALELVKTSGLCPPGLALPAALGRRVFRPDLHDLAANQLQTRPSKNDTHETTPLPL